MYHRFDGSEYHNKSLYFSFHLKETYCPVPGVQSVKRRKVVTGTIVATEWKEREAWIA